MAVQASVPQQEADAAACTYMLTNLVYFLASVPPRGSGGALHGGPTSPPYFLHTSRPIHTLIPRAAVLDPAAVEGQAKYLRHGWDLFEMTPYYYPGRRSPAYVAHQCRLAPLNASCPFPCPRLPHTSLVPHQRAHVAAQAGAGWPPSRVLGAAAGCCRRVRSCHVMHAASSEAAGLLLPHTQAHRDAMTFEEDFEMWDHLQHAERKVQKVCKRQVRAWAAAVAAAVHMSPQPTTPVCPCVQFQLPRERRDTQLHTKAQLRDNIRQRR